MKISPSPILVIIHQPCRWPTTHIRHYFTNYFHLTAQKTAGWSSSRLQPRRRCTRREFGSASLANPGTKLYQQALLSRTTLARSSISGLRCNRPTRRTELHQRAVLPRQARGRISISGLDLSASHGVTYLRRRGGEWIPEDESNTSGGRWSGSGRRADTPRQGVSEGGRNGVTERFPGPAVAPRLLVKTSRRSVSPTAQSRSR